VFADLIFPVFTTPYFVYLGVPWAIILALLSEIIIYRRMIPGPSNVSISVSTICSNLFSWLVGAILSIFLPFGYMTGHSVEGHGYVFSGYAVLAAFVIAWAVSVFLEGWVWRIILRRRGKLPIWKATMIANAASYLLLLAIFFAWNRFSLQTGI